MTIIATVRRADLHRTYRKEIQAAVAGSRAPSVAAHRTRGGEVAGPCSENRPGF